MKLPKTYEELKNSNFFQEHGITYFLAQEQIRLAYKNGFLEAIPEMLEVKDDWLKMREIRLAYKYKVLEAVPYMLKVRHDWRKMDAILLSFVNEKLNDLNKIKIITDETTKNLQRARKQ